IDGRPARRRRVARRRHAARASPDGRRLLPPFIAGAGRRRPSLSRARGTPMTHAGPRGGIDRILAVERINTWLSLLSSWALLAMTVIVGIEVLSRYLLNQPTIWAWDVNVQLLLLLLMLGMAEVYRRDAHVRVDVFTAGLGPR